MQELVRNGWVELLLPGWDGCTAIVPDLALAAHTAVGSRPVYFAVEERTRWLRRMSGVARSAVVEHSVVLPET